MIEVFDPKTKKEILREVIDLSEARGNPVWIFSTPSNQSMLVSPEAPNWVKSLSGKNPKDISDDELLKLKEWLLSLPRIVPLAANEELLEMTKTGKAAAWERGGGFSKTGASVIWTGLDGKPLRPLFVRRKGERACKEHALLPINVGYFCIKATRNAVTIFVVENLGKRFVRSPFRADWVATLKKVYQGPADGAPEFLKAAAKAAVEKASCYHCRTPHYIADD